jgi:hypothetical protein
MLGMTVGRRTESPFEESGDGLMERVGRGRVYDVPGVRWRHNRRIREDFSEHFYTAIAQGSVFTV